MSTKQPKSLQIRASPKAIENNPKSESNVKSDDTTKENSAKVVTRPSKQPATDSVAPNESTKIAEGGTKCGSCEITKTDRNPVVTYITTVNTEEASCLPSITDKITNSGYHSDELMNNKYGKSDAPEEIREQVDGQGIGDRTNEFDVIVAILPSSDNPVTQVNTAKQDDIKPDVSAIVTPADSDKSQPISSRNEKHCRELLFTLRSQCVAGGEHCDTVIMVNKAELWAHSCVLSAVSPKLAMLVNEAMSGIIETHTMPVKRLTFPCDSTEVVDSLLDYIYTGHLLITFDIIEHVLELAGFLEIPDLHQFCISMLCSQISLQTWFRLHVLAQKFDLQELSLQVQTFCLTFFSKIIMSAEFQLLTLPEVKNIICNSNLSNSPNCEVLKLNAIWQWIVGDTDERLTFYEEFASLLNPEFLTQESIKKICTQNTMIFLNNPITKNLVTKTSSEREFMDVDISDEEGSGTEEQLLEQDVCEAEGERECNIPKKCTKRQKKMWENRKTKAAHSGPNIYKGKKSLSEESDKELEDIKVSRMSRIKIRKCVKERKHVKEQGSVMKPKRPRGRPKRTEEERKKDEEEGRSKLPMVCQFEDCKKVFMDPASYKYHIKRHDPRSVLLCDICGFTTIHAKSMAGHMGIHNGMKHKCDFPGCDYGAVGPGKLREHKNMHLGIRDNICHICGKTYTYLKHLQRHERTHFPQEPHQCPVCDFKNIRKDKLSAHIRSHHKQYAIDNGYIRSQDLEQYMAKPEVRRIPRTPRDPNAPPAPPKKESKRKKKASNPRVKVEQIADEQEAIQWVVQDVMTATSSATTSSVQVPWGGSTAAANGAHYMQQLTTLQPTSVPQTLPMQRVLAPCTSVAQLVQIDVPVEIYTEEVGQSPAYGTQQPRTLTIQVKQPPPNSM